MSNCSVRDVTATGGSASATGISGNAVSNCSVSTITGPTGSGGGASGITSPSPKDGTVSNCRVSFVTGSGAVGISAQAVADSVVASLQHSAARTTTLTGIRAYRVTACTVEGCSANTTATSAGIVATQVHDCVVSSIINAGAGPAVGIDTSTNSSNLIRGCTVHRNNAPAGSIGIRCLQPARVEGCTVAGHAIGISVGVTHCVADGNTVNSSTTGIAGAGSTLIVRNRTTNCPTDYSTDASSQIGPIVNATGTIASTNPWANFRD